MPKTFIRLQYSLCALSYLIVFTRIPLSDKFAGAEMFSEAFYQLNEYN